MRIADKMVVMTGLEPARVSPLVSQTNAFTVSPHDQREILRFPSQT